MIVYVSSDYSAKSVLADLQSKRTSKPNQANFLSCPAVRGGFRNVWMFSSDNDLTVKYNLDNAKEINGFDVDLHREPHLQETNIFNLCKASFFFSEEALTMKATAPYFHNVEYLKKGTFIGGVFDIGKWYRPVQSEIVTWQEEGVITFKANEPIFYVEFLTDEKITLVKYNHTPMLATLCSALVNSPFQDTRNMQGTLDTRYAAFEQSSYREAILEEIKASLVSEDSASPSV
jgi:hypothetical protein